MGQEIGVFKDLVPFAERESQEVVFNVMLQREKLLGKTLHLLTEVLGLGLLIEEFVGQNYEGFPRVELLQKGLELFRGNFLKVVVRVPELRVEVVKVDGNVSDDFLVVLGLEVVLLAVD